MKKYFIDLLKNWLGPAMVAVIIGGYWAYSDIQAKNEALQIMSEQTQIVAEQRDALLLVFNNQCTQLLESQGHVVTKVESPLTPE
jgi:hypothetical protein